MRITEGQLRRIIRQELNEMKGATFHRDLKTGEWKSGREDFPGAGAEMARQMREPTEFSRPKWGSPEVGERFEKMFSSLDLDRPEEYEGMAAAEEELPPAVANMMDDILTKLRERGLTRLGLETAFTGGLTRRDALQRLKTLDQALNALMVRGFVTQDGGVFKPA